MLDKCWKKPLPCARISGFEMEGRFSHILGSHVSFGGCIYATILVASKTGIFRDIRNYIGLVEAQVSGK